jgi:hypothetical protein
MLHPRSLIRAARPLCAAVLLTTAAAACQPVPGVVPLRTIVFPVAANVRYTDTFGAARSGGRSHEGQDLMAPKGTVAVAAVDGVVTSVRHDTSGLSGNMLRITDAEGWQYVYIHLNNDRPGTDNGANRYDEAFADGIRAGQRVKAGEPVGFVGDSGNAENAGSHLHFEIVDPQGVAVNAFSSLQAAPMAALSPAQLDASRPFGHIDVLASSGAGSVAAVGWAADHAVASPSDITLLIDGNPHATFPAAGSRPDVAAAFPGITAEHGFSRTIAGITPGLHHACLVVHNAGAGGGSTRLGCVDLAVG